MADSRLDTGALGASRRFALAQHGPDVFEVTVTTRRLHLTGLGTEQVLVDENELMDAEQ
jgi:hypothetical protein